MALSLIYLQHLLSIFFFLYCFVHHRDLHSFPTRRSSDLQDSNGQFRTKSLTKSTLTFGLHQFIGMYGIPRSEEHTSELQSLRHLVCRLLLEKKKTTDLPGEYRRRRFALSLSQEQMQSILM